MLIKLSAEITTPAEARTLGTVGLGVRSSVVNTCLTDNTSINEAAFKILDHWFQNQEDPVKAYQKLCAVLRDKLGKAALTRYLTDD